MSASSIKLLLLVFLALVFTVTDAGLESSLNLNLNGGSSSIISAYSSSRKKSIADYGPSPFVDETTGQCTLNPCDALGRARDELYSVLDEKEKVHSQSQTIIGELQSAAQQGRFVQEQITSIIQFMDKRLRSLEQPGQLL